MRKRAMSCTASRGNPRAARDAYALDDVRSRLLDDSPWSTHCNDHTVQLHTLHASAAVASVDARIRRGERASDSTRVDSVCAVPSNVPPSANRVPTGFTLMRSRKLCARQWPGRGPKGPRSSEESNHGTREAGHSARPCNPRRPNRDKAEARALELLPRPVNSLVNEE